MLMDHADPGSDRILRAGDPTGLALDLDGAGVGLIEAVENVHQGRLAGTVFTNDAVNRPRRDHQVDVLVGVDRAEVLVDPPQLDRRRR